MDFLQRFRMGGASDAEYGERNAFGKVKEE